MSITRWGRLGRLLGLLPAPLVATVADVALAVLAAVANGIRIAMPGSPGAPLPDVPAFVIGALMAAGLVVRRRWPMATLLWVWCWWFAYHVLDYPGGAPAVPVWIALYTAAAAERRRGFVPVVVFILLSDMLGRAQEGTVVWLSTSLDSSTIAWAALLLLGDAVRSRRRLRAETRARLARAADDQEAEAQRRVAGERLRIARELHDVTAHTISVIAVQSGVAAETLEDDPGRARAALGVIRAASREALDELQATVGVLRQPDTAPEAAGLNPMPGLGQLDDLVGMAAAGGVNVRVTVDGQARRLPAAVDLTAYRAVQESLTNVLRHADATMAAVLVRYQPDGVLLEVDDDGVGPPAGHGGDGAGAPADLAAAGGAPGYGLLGMRERVAAVGGSVRSGRGPRGGLMLRVWLPTARAPA